MGGPVNVLVACEFSGAVREAFRAQGHEAWSCDLLPSPDPTYHLQRDVREVLGDGWDLMIAHPPCTYLSVSGMHWTTRGLRDPALTDEALAFVRLLLAAPIPRIAVENPVSVISTRIRRPDQIIQPWQYGHNASKTTCLWLQGLPRLAHGTIVPPRGWHCSAPGQGRKIGGYWFDGGDGRPTWANQTPSGQNRLGPSADRWKLRSATYAGIAAAMAAQWGDP